MNLFCSNSQSQRNATRKTLKLQMLYEEENCKSLSADISADSFFWFISGMERIEKSICFSYKS